jgi:putative aminopeptidase FrvX
MMKLLKDLCEIHAPSGEEKPMKDFIMAYVRANMHKWSARPIIIEGPQFQDNLVLQFGIPRTAIFAHMDSVGFTVSYHDQLLPIGQPDVEQGYKLSGSDELGPIVSELIYEEGTPLRYKFPRGIQRGTSLVFQPDYRENGQFVQCAGLDNRLGIYVTLKIAETLRDGFIIFSCWEEHGGGAVPVLAKFMYEQHNVSQALISDITWATEGVEQGKGVAISMRDRNIPRQEFIRKIIGFANASGVQYQLEVEGSGSSDGRELQLSPYPIDWCFIGAAEKNVHSPDELVHVSDIDSMIRMYRYLMEVL